MSEIMYFLSKIIWIVLSPLNLFVILLLISVLFSKFRKNIASRIFYLLSIFFFIIIGVFPTGNLILSKLESNYPVLEDMPDDINGILILGGPTSYYLTNQHNQVSFNESGERLTEAYKLIKKFNSIKIIFSGAQHTYVANKFFREMGINEDIIIFESKSRNTYENILFSKTIINPEKDEKWLLITSSFHMKRTLSVAEKLNWKLIPYPVDFRTGAGKIIFIPNINKTLDHFNSFNLAFHEIVGLASYYFLGRANKMY